MYQSLFRALAGTASVASLIGIKGFDTSGPDLQILIGASLIALVYIVASTLVLRGLDEDTERHKTSAILGYIDAFLIGVFAVVVDFSMFPVVFFFTMIQFNALSSGGLRRWLEHNAALIAGLLMAIALKQPTWDIRFDYSANLIALVAFVLYFSIYGYFIYNRHRFLQLKMADAEKLQVQLKLRNYKLSKYLSPALRKAISSGKDVKLETQRKKVTIFFSDIKGFSELAEEMEADQLTALLNSYLTEMSEIAIKFGGTIDKFIGDAIMIFFGDPVSRGAKADCVACVSMALTMRKRMKELQLRWLNQGIQKPLQIRTGINTGFCTVGNFGTENRLDYTLLGTEVNLANRLESAAEPGEILISHETYSLIKDVIMCRDKGEVTVKGFQHPVKVYSVVDMRKNLGKDQSYFEHLTEGFSMYLDVEKIRNYDKDKILGSLEKATKRLRDKSIL